MVSNSGIHRKFPSGGQVSSQSCDVRNQLGECRSHDHYRVVRGMPRKNLAKLHLKIRIFVHLAASFSIMLLGDLLEE